MITHKPHFQGGGNPYIAPELEIVTVEVEKGFANSGVVDPYDDWGEEDKAGKIDDGYNYEF